MSKKLINGMFSSISDAELFAASLAADNEQATDTSPGTAANAFAAATTDADTDSEGAPSPQQEPGN